MEPAPSTGSPIVVRKGLPSRRSLWPVVAVLAVVVVALAVALVVIRSQDGRPRAAVGQVFADPSDSESLPHLGEVLLPWARTEVGAGDVREELPDLEGAEPNVRAPDGGSFVRVEMDLANDYPVPYAAVGLPFAAQIDVVLHADGRDYPVPEVAIDPDQSVDQGGSRWVAVDGEPGDLEVRVTVDGVTQVVDASDGSVDAGQAADLARLAADDVLAPAPSTRCGAPRRLDTTNIYPSYRPDLTCKVGPVLRMPYVDGLGWAEPGREFVVLQVVRPRELQLASGRGTDKEFWISDVDVTVRLGGADPVAPPVRANHLGTGSIVDPEDPDQEVFDVAAGEPLGDLTVEVVAAARIGEPFVTARRDVTFRWTIAGGELA